MKVVIDSIYTDKKVTQTYVANSIGVTTSPQNNIVIARWYKDELDITVRFDDFKIEYDKRGAIRVIEVGKSAPPDLSDIKLPNQPVNLLVDKD